jgi:hypothetical protein
MRRLLTAARAALPRTAGRATALRALAAVLCGSLSAQAFGQAAPGPSPFVVLDSQVLVLKNVRVIDGLGSPPREGQTILIAGAGSRLSTPPSISLKGRRSAT